MLTRLPIYYSESWLIRLLHRADLAAFRGAVAGTLAGMAADSKAASTSMLYDWAGVPIKADHRDFEGLGDAVQDVARKTSSEDGVGTDGDSRAGHRNRRGDAAVCDELADEPGAGGGGDVGGIRADRGDRPGDDAGEDPGSAAEGNRLAARVDGGSEESVWSRAPRTRWISRSDRSG